MLMTMGFVKVFVWVKSTVPAPARVMTAVLPGTPVTSPPKVRLLLIVSVVAALGRVTVFVNVSGLGLVLVLLLNDVAGEGERAADRHEVVERSAVVLTRVPAVSVNSPWAERVRVVHDHRGRAADRGPPQVGVVALKEGRARTGERQVGDAGQRRGEVNAPRVVEGHRQGRADQGAGVRERQGRVGPQPGIPEGDVDGRWRSRRR